MENKQFAQLVKNMRDAQKNYFMHRTQFYLNQAKAMEKMVDSATEEMLKEEKPDPQGKLF